MYKVGVVGPNRSVERIMGYVGKVKTDLTFIGFPYNIANETFEILENHHTSIDYWLFSGNIPYTVAQQSPYFSSDHMEYIYITVNSFYRGIFELSHEIGSLVKNVSIDALSILDPDYLLGLEQLKKYLNHLYFKLFEPETSVDEIIAYHIELWEKGNIDGVITAYPIVEQTLKEKGIPAYWTGPMEQDILHTIELFSEKIRTAYYKETQATALIVQVKDFNSIKNEHPDGYRIHFLQLNLTKIVLQICEKIDGYFIDEGNGRFILFSSRGIVERNINTIYEMFHRLEVEADRQVLVGIGHATTVYYAEKYANQALQQAEEQNIKGIIIMREDGSITEFQQDSPKITYSSRTENMEVVEKLQKTSISPKMFSKIEAVIQHLKLENFSAKTLAKELEMTDRNAQRILSELLSVGLVEYCGIEKRNTRGRSAKLYKLSD